MTQAQYFYNQAERRKSIYSDLGTYKTSIDKEPKKPDPKPDPKKVVAKRKRKERKVRKVLLMIHIPTNTKIYSMRELYKFLNRHDQQSAMANVIKNRSDYEMVNFPKFTRARKIEHVKTGKVYNNIYAAAWELNIGCYGIEKHIEHKTGEWRWVC